MSETCTGKLQHLHCTRSLKKRSGHTGYELRTHCEVATRCCQSLAPAGGLREVGRRAAALGLSARAHHNSCYIQHYTNMIHVKFYIIHVTCNINHVKNTDALG